MSSRRRSALRGKAALGMLLLACPPAVLAADGNWSASAVDGNWSNPANWQGGVIASGPGATANFLTDVNGFQSIGIASPGVTIGTLRFGDSDPATPGPWSLEGSSLTFSGEDCELRILPSVIVRSTAAVIANGGLRLTGGGEFQLFSSLNMGASSLSLDDALLTLRAPSSVGQLLSINLATPDRGNINLFFNSDGALASAAASTSINISTSGHEITSQVVDVKTGLPKVNRIDSHISIAANQSATLRAERDGVSTHVPGYVRFTGVQLGAGSTLHAEAVSNHGANLVLDLALLGDATIDNSSSSLVHLGQITATSPATLKLTGSNNTQLIGSLGANLEIRNTATTILTCKTAALGPAASFVFNGNGRQISVKSGTTRLEVDPAANLTGTSRGRIDLSGNAGALELCYNAAGTSPTTGQNLDIALANGRSVTAFANAASPLLATYAPRIVIAADGNPSTVDATLGADKADTGASASYVYYTDLRSASGTLVQLESPNGVGLIANLTLSGDAAIQTPTANQVHLNSISGAGTLTLADASGNRALNLVGPLGTDILIASNAGANLSSLSDAGFSSSFSLGGRTLTLASSSGVVDVRTDPGAGTIRLAGGPELLIISRGSDGAPGLSASTHIDLEAGTRLSAPINQSATSLVNTIGAAVRVRSTASISAARGRGSGVPGLARFSNVTLDDGATLTVDAVASNLLVDLHIPAGSASVQQISPNSIAHIGRIDGPGTLILPDTPNSRPLAFVGLVNADVIQSNASGALLGATQIGSYQSAFSLGPHTLTIRGGTSAQPVRLAASANPGSEGTFLVDGGTLRLERSADAALIHKSGRVIVTADQSLASLRADATLDLNGFDLRTPSLAGSGAIVNSSFDADSILTIDAAANCTYAGAFRDSGGDHALSLVKTGPASLTLAGPLGHGGSTLVNAGQLIVNGNVARSRLAIANSATLSGNGTIGGPVSVESGGTIHPTGVLTLRQLSLQSNSTLAFNLGSPFKSDSLLLTDSGGLSVAGPVSLRITDTGLLPGTTYTLIDYAGSSLDNSILNLFTLNAPSGHDYQLVNDPAKTAITLLVRGAPDAPHQWIADADGDWSNSANWSTGVPNASSAQVYLGDVIQSPRTITVNTPRTLGQLTLDTPRGYTLSGSGRLTFDNGSARASLTVARGNHAIRVPSEFASSATLYVVHGSTLDLASLAFHAGATLTKSGQGPAAISAPLDLPGGTLEISAGTLTLASPLHAHAVSIHPSATLVLSNSTSVIDTLSIDAENGSYLGLFDLARGSLILHPPADSRLALAEIQSMIRSARNASAGLWTGPGLTTSAVNPLYGLAAILNQDAQGKPLYATFAGQPVDANSILVKYTPNGDADLNGKVDGADYFLIDMGFLSRNSSKPLSGYYNGDFDYNGIVDGADYFLIDMAYLGTRTINSLAASSSAVPEPAALPLSLLPLCLLFRPRR